MMVTNNISRTKHRGELENNRDIGGDRHGLFGADGLFDGAVIGCDHPTEPKLYGNACG